MKQRVILFGPPGSGKGTFAKLLQKEFGLTHVSSGHWLRKEVELGTAMGRKVQSFLDKGELVPDDMVLEFMEQRLLRELEGPGFLLDGFPRTLAQAKAMDAWLEERGRPIQRVVLFQCSEAVILDRITGRRVCPECGRGYHIRTQRPLAEGRCDHCPTALVQREDDREDVLHKRLTVYEAQTKPLIEYFQEQGKLVVVDTEQSLGVTYADSVDALNQ